MDELVLPFAHHLTPPAHHRVVIHRAVAVGNHQVLINADDVSETFTCGTGAQRIVEVEHQVGWFLKGDAVQFKPFGETMLDGGAVR